MLFEVKIKARELKNWELLKVQRAKKELVDSEEIDDKHVECGASGIDEDNLLMPKLPSIKFGKKKYKQKIYAI